MFNEIWILVIDILGCIESGLIFWVYPVPLLTSEYHTGLILGLHPANERRRYKVTQSLIGWEQI